MRNFKILVGFLTITLLLVGGSIITSRFLSPVDVWVCDDGEWIKKGNPGIPIPNEKCEKKVVKDEEKEDEDGNSDSLIGVNFINEESDLRLKIPSSWEGKYEETEVIEDGIKRFIFNYKGGNDSSSLLFIINVIPGTQDVYSVENQPNNKIIAQSKKYFYTVSSALDIPFMPEEADHDIYLRMIKDVDDIIETSILGGEIASRSLEIIERDEDGKSNINISYPMMVGVADRPEINNYIRNKVLGVVDEFKNNLANWDPTGAPEEAYSSLWLNYRLVSVTRDIVSIEFYGLEYYRGAAYPNGYSFSINYDLNKDENISLSSIFNVSEEESLEKIASLVKEDLEAQFETQEFETDTLMFKEGTKPTVFNYKNFILAEDSITFYFDPSHIAPHGLGSFKVVISLDKLEDILKNDFIE